MSETEPFSFITDSYEKLMLDTAYQAITSLELWEYMSQPNEGYMLSSDKELGLIMNEIVKLGYDGHSGGSFGCTMRDMQYIATHGLLKYKEARQRQRHPTLSS